MLKIAHYRTLQDKESYLKTLDFSEITLVVADMESKQLWQNWLIKHQGYCHGPQVLRAIELWETLFQRAEPDWQIVSNRWILAYINSQLTLDKTQDFGLPFVKGTTVFRGLNEFMPILSHPDSIEIMESWFSNEENPVCAWKNLFYLCEDLWSRLRESKSILREWAAPFLVNAENFEKFWHRPLVIDVGPEIRTVEVELLQILSRQTEITILAPHPERTQNFPWVSYPYEQFQGVKPSLMALTEAPIETPCRLHFKRFAGQLGEVKAAISLIQEWLKAGVLPEQIAVLAPDIEHYWPSLSWHFKKEGIKTSKVKTTSLLQLPSLIAWVTRLKVASHQPWTQELQILSQFYPLNYKEGDFEQHLAHWKKKLTFPVAPSYALTTQVATQDSVADEYVVDRESDSASNFLDWAFSLFPDLEESLGTHVDSVYSAIEKWLLEASTLPPLPRKDWVFYLESVLQESEVELNSPLQNKDHQKSESLTEDGITLCSLMAGLSSQRSHFIFLGCSESQLKSGSGLVKGSEILSLHHHTGHLLAHPDRDFRDFQLQYLLKLGKEAHLFFAETDFDGTELVPAMAWLKGRRTSGEDLHQKNTWYQSRWEQELLKPLTQKPSRSTFSIDGVWTQTLSPATLQNFISCPFRYFAEKGLNLSETPVVDLELDPRTNGTIRHRLLELLTPHPFEAEDLRGRLSEIVNQVMGEHSDDFFSPKTIELITMDLLHFAQRFIDYEVEYRTKHPRFYTAAREAWFKKVIDFGSQTLTFRGKIDRLDLSLDDQGAIVIDYKGDIASLRNAGSWLDNIEFQLPAYSMAAEEGLIKLQDKTPLPPIKVIAAHYLGLKDFTRKGFTLDSGPPEVVETPTNKSSISMEEKESLLKNFNQILLEAGKKVISGEFLPIPHPKTDCQKCSWRNICRSDKQNL